MQQNTLTLMNLVAIKLKLITFCSSFFRLRCNDRKARKVGGSERTGLSCASRRYYIMSRLTPRFGKIFDVIVRYVISPKAALTEGGWTATEAGQCTERALGACQSSAHARVDLAISIGTALRDILGIM